MLPEIDRIICIEVDTPRYWPLRINLRSAPRTPTSTAEHAPWTQRRIIFVKRKTGYLPYAEDPHGVRRVEGSKSYRGGGSCRPYPFQSQHADPTRLFAGAEHPGPAIPKAKERGGWRRGSGGRSRAGFGHDGRVCRGVLGRPEHLSICAGQPLNGLQLPFY